MLKNLFSIPNYHGRILQGPFSRKLKKRISSYIDTFKMLERLDSHLMPYLAAWQEDEKSIWYEYVSPLVARTLRCDEAQVARTLRQNITTRRIYKYSNCGEDIQEETVSGSQIRNARSELRKNSKNTGVLEAVYKVRISVTFDYIWLKDEAGIETYPDDNICISVGSLTNVTKEMQAEEGRERLVNELQEALKNIKALSGLLPICADCKKIRDDDGYWNQLESYLSEHSDVHFSHGICPECAEKFYKSLK